ncbi:lasso peptide biosynthesis B2 protein [Thermobifida cellulosilytica]|uniref:Polyketide beta-ketoacyl synthase n=1 Tax=Thermobifida cellulosilytica TB100 TaxID=665004 RepID=A0A147KME6_THECS|nr:lasso peptide biosynthesis B2 protein [Thermobifida cellulosilytica]KUP98505.1 polyketide beta-ketoacyl synthase [Thermobifida cellulosilytica TB100]
MSEYVVLQRSDVRLSLGQRWAARCAVGLARLLARRSPERIRATLRRLRGTVRPATYPEAKAARDAVLAVSLRCAGLEACLQRSLAVALLCRMRGTWATWCVGVPRRPPFAGHAWVEAEGRLVEEGVDYDYFSRLITVD